MTPLEKLKQNAFDLALIRCIGFEVQIEKGADVKVTDTHVLITRKGIKIQTDQSNPPQTADVIQEIAISTIACIDIVNFTIVQPVGNIITMGQA